MTGPPSSFLDQREEHSKAASGGPAPDAADSREFAEFANKAAFLAAIVETSNDAILSKTTTGEVTSWNSGAHRIFGHSAEEIIGKSIRLIIPKDRQAEEDAILAQIVAGKQIENYETVRLTKSGVPLDVSITVSPIRAASGRIIGASKIARDISERKRQEAQTLSLLREVNHRSKNLMAVIQSIANLTNANGIFEYKRKFIDRIHVLSAVQDLLVANFWMYVDFHSLLHSILLPFQKSNNARIGIIGAETRLRPEASQSLGLALHELATNAVIFGALSSKAGRVEVKWTAEGDEFVLTWIEQGGPAASDPIVTGFGTNLLKVAVERALDAKVSIGFDASGMKWRLTAPRSRICV